MYPQSIAGTRETGRSIQKIDIIQDAYSQLRISGLTTMPTVEDLELALVRLEDMAAMWEADNVIVGYNFEQEPGPNESSGVQPAFKQAFAKNLAVQLVPDFNLNAPQTLYQSARGAFSSMCGAAAVARLQQVPYPDRMPIGSGNEMSFNRWARFYRNYPSFINTTQSEQIFIGDVDSYSFHFDSTLIGNEYIEAYELQLDNGLVLVGSDLDDSKNSIDYKVKAVGVSDSRHQEGGSQVTAIVKTSGGRVITLRMFFSLTPRNSNVVSTI